MRKKGGICATHTNFLRIKGGIEPRDKWWVPRPSVVAARARPPVRQPSGDIRQGRRDPRGPALDQPSADLSRPFSHPIPSTHLRWRYRHDFLKRPVVALG